MMRTKKREGKESRHINRYIRASSERELIFLIIFVVVVFKYPKDLSNIRSHLVRSLVLFWRWIPRRSVRATSHASWKIASIHRFISSSNFSIRPIFDSSWVQLSAWICSVSLFFLVRDYRANQQQSSSYVFWPCSISWRWWWNMSALNWIINRSTEERTWLFWFQQHAKQSTFWWMDLSRWACGPLFWWVCK